MTLEGASVRMYPLPHLFWAQRTAATGRVHRFPSRYASAVSCGIASGPCPSQRLPPYRLHLIDRIEPCLKRSTCPPQVESPHPHPLLPREPHRLVTVLIQPFRPVPQG